jgi:hypothetical protein
MAQRNKKTTMAKLAREHKLRERRVDKQARKDARRLAASDDAPRLDDAPGLDDAPLLDETPEPKEA